MTTPRATILVVEDNEASADMVRRRLERRGFAVLTAGTSETALEQARAHQPALILMDLSLPDRDGLETTRLLKAQTATAEIPVVALTAHAFVTDRDRSLAAGCEGFETKPLNFDHLLATIDLLIGRRTQHV